MTDLDVYFRPTKELLNNPFFNEGAALAYREYGPSYSKEDDGAMDLRACLDKPIWIRPGECVKVDAGFDIWIGAKTDKNVAALVMPRSGLSLNAGIGLGNFVGLVDKGYQGRLIMGLWNRTITGVQINPADRVAQIMFIPIYRAKPVIVSAFDEQTDRGAGGIGHTGVDDRAKQEEKIDTGIGYAFTGFCYV